VIDLDDAAAIAAADPGGMLAAVGELGADCRAGYEAGRQTGDLPHADGVATVTLAGMGGSAVGGEIVRAVYAARLGVPVDVVRSPVLPEYCGPHSLVVCTSYSGNTAETLSVFGEAVERGCRVIAITSGGELAARAEANDEAVVTVPSGMQPRAALGHLAFGLLGALESVGVLPRASDDVDDASMILEQLGADLGPANGGSRAKAIARSMGDRVPVVWGAEGLGSVAAMRWKTQLNENAKTPAFHASMSELDHNELAGWTKGTGDRFFLVALRHQGEVRSTAERFTFSADVARQAGAGFAEVSAEGSSPLAQLMSLIAIGDFTSVYLGLLRGEDPTQVDVIVRLKDHLASA
jgi:glucose/mannose-6-phosphate isomerase